jgi:hypothetical protein
VPFKNRITSNKIKSETETENGVVFQVCAVLLVALTTAEEAAKAKDKEAAVEVQAAASDKKEKRGLSAGFGGGDHGSFGKN